MNAFAVIGGIWTLLSLFYRVTSLGESKRMLKGKFEYLKARISDIEDMERAYLFSRIQRGRKRKRDNDLCVWVADGRKLLKVAEDLLIKVEEHGSYLRSVNKLIDTLVLHERKGDMLYRHAFSGRGSLHSGSHIPVKTLIGTGSLNTLSELECLLHDTKVGRVAIHGNQGIGKTFLMKHLHNSVLKWAERFAYVFWVSFPDEFSVKRVQDAVAATVKCAFSSIDDLNVRARELSKKLGDLGNFVLFLDNVPKADFSLDQIGIPVPAEGTASKLVFTTSSTTLGCRMLDGFKTVELDRLSENEAFQLFLREAKIDMRSVTLFNSIPWLLTMKCHGTPRMIVDTASHKCGIHDLHEWNNALFELGNLEKRSKLSKSGH